MCKCKAMGLLQSGIMAGSHCGSSDHGSLDHCVQLVGYNRRINPHHTGSFVIHGIPRGDKMASYTLPWEITLAVWQMSRRLLLYEN